MQTLGICKRNIENLQSNLLTVYAMFCSDTSVDCRSMSISKYVCACMHRNLVFSARIESANRIYV